MPSTKDPISTVSPGPGKLPAGTVTASAFIFMGGGGGGSSAALLAHITDPVDAHMASAIGVNPFYPPGGTIPVLSSVGGPIDGESVLDFIFQAKDLFPIRPDKMGFNVVSVPNSGLPTWGIGGSRGAYTSGTNAIFSHFITPNGAVSAPTVGTLYPADRGVLAVYFSTDGDFLNAGMTTLYAALWLGTAADKPIPLTCPSAAFDESLRTGLQLNYTAANVGLDKISLTQRLPYLKDYVPFGSPYLPYDANFPAYQLATFSLFQVAYGAGAHGSYLIVHWKESYVGADADIAPAAMAANYLVGNVYSAYPPNYDAIPENSAGIQSINRRYIFRDALSATAPSLASWTVTENGVPPTVKLSGVSHYTAPLTFTTDTRVDDLVANGWLTGTHTTGTYLPPEWITTTDPVEYDFADFGGGVEGRSYWQVRQTGAGANYTNTAAPQPADQVQYIDPVFAYSGILAPHTPTGGAAFLRLNMRRPEVSVTNVLSPTAFLYNTWPQTGGGTSSTSTFEPFRDEKYRYKLSAVITATSAIIPTVGDHFDSVPALVAGDSHIQVIGDHAVYPQVDYGAALYHPVGGPNYAAVLAGDPGIFSRLYIRLFDTGIARNTGKFRIRGLTLADFTAGPFTGNLIVDHPGGAGLFCQVPGFSGTLDLGRALGDPDLNLALDLRGCQVGVLVSGPDIIVSYNTSFFTGDNGSGDFPIVFALALIKGPGTGLSLDEVEWLPP